MKVLVVIALIAMANAKGVHQTPSAYGYIQNMAIPLAERIFEAETTALGATPSRIIGGNLAQPGQFPYQAGLITLYEGIDGRGVCGGSLVSANRVLTAAHCWYDGINQGYTVEVVLGSLTLFTGGTRLDTSYVVIHPNWIPTRARNDVAVIYLPNSVSFSANISPIALPSGAELDENFAGVSVIASGFGLTTNNGNIAITQALSHVQLSVISNSVCRLAFPLYLQDSNICTSSIGNVSTCRGDSGGPLVTLNANPVLVGITSFGSGLGCESSMPAAFARVTSFMDFFNQHL